jgi:hypothetical protein
VDLRDLIITPFLLVLVYTGAYLLRGRLTDEITRRYFIPALTCKIFGALALGMLYQFYYGGGDTFNFHTHGSRHIWEAFWSDPEKGLKLMFPDKNDYQGIYEYARRIPFFHDPSSYTVIRLAAFFDLFTFSAYSATAIFFSVIGFVGLWLLFKCFYELYPEHHRAIAMATMFIPSVIFWGSGLLKDTITLACLGMVTFFVKRLFLDRRFKTSYVVFLLVALYAIFSIKKYILISYLPAVIMWIYLSQLGQIRSVMLKVLMFPAMTVLVVVVSYFAIDQVGKDDSRYALGQLSTTAKVTAYDIAYQTGRDAGSSYSLGELDGSFGNMMSLAPQAVNVSLFRPYLWEVRNPLMLMSAFEAVATLGLTLGVIFTRRRTIFGALANPHVIFCLIFSLTFAFAVGISSFNFGTLSRYKIPLLPFYALALILLYKTNRPDTVSEFDFTE